jgi:hypothetical protein
MVNGSARALAEWANLHDKYQEKNHREICNAGLMPGGCRKARFIGSGASDLGIAGGEFHSDGRIVELVLKNAAAGSN